MATLQRSGKLPKWIRPEYRDWLRQIKRFRLSRAFDLDLSQPENKKRVSIIQTQADDAMKFIFLFWAVGILGHQENENILAIAASLLLRYNILSPNQVDPKLAARAYLPDRYSHEGLANLLPKKDPYSDWPEWPDTDRTRKYLRFAADSLKQSGYLYAGSRIEQHLITAEDSELPKICNYVNDDMNRISFRAWEFLAAQLGEKPLCDREALKYCRNLEFAYPGWFAGYLLAKSFGLTGHSTQSHPDRAFRARFGICDSAEYGFLYAARYQRLKTVNQYFYVKLEGFPTSLYLGEQGDFAFGAIYQNGPIDDPNTLEELYTIRPAPMTIPNLGWQRMRMSKISVDSFIAIFAATRLLREAF
ncbi:MAG: hypothetical protein ABIE84_06695 [bacterium]